MTAEIRPNVERRTKLKKVAAVGLYIPLIGFAAAAIDKDTTNMLWAGAFIATLAAIGYLGFSSNESS